MATGDILTARIIWLKLRNSKIYFYRNEKSNLPSPVEISLWLHDDMLGHVMWSRDQTGHKYPALSYIFQLLAPAHLPNYPRRKSFTLNFSLLFSSRPTISSFILEWAKLFYDYTKLCFSRISIASYWNFSARNPNCVLPKALLHVIEFTLRQIEDVPLPKFIISIASAGQLYGTSPRSQPRSILT